MPPIEPLQTTDRLTFSTEELLADMPVSAPLIAGEVLCHGGFDQEGHYCSPRTLHRNPAVANWQRQLTRAGHSLIEISPSLIPPQCPSFEQAKLMIKAGVRDPIVRSLTVISILEGFGAVIRDVRVPSLGHHFLENIDGTALAHLELGLFEAHARDEAGYKDQGGHKQMWEAARDLALEKPKIPPDVFLRLMGDRGQQRPSEPLFPQLDKSVYRMLATMAQVLAVEVFATRTFDWGVQVLSDPEISAEPVRAADMVRYIRSDENPHVEYLRTALSEARALTLRTVDGKTLAGATVVDGLLHQVLSRMTTARPREQHEDTRKGLERAIESSKARRSLLEEFDQLQPVWTPPARTGFEAAAA
jgi:hypothetical protein